MRVFKNVWFEKFAKQEKITDQSLLSVIKQAQDGLIDADLGGGLLKLRIARQGAGKSGGYRTIVCFQKDSKAVFAYGFAKNKQANLERTELAALKRLGQVYFALDDVELAASVSQNKLIEVVDHDEH
jgi:hypothetical protein